MGPCFDFEIKQKNFDIKPEEARRIWDFAKENYIDRGIPMERAIVEMSRETGAPPRFFAEAFAGKKGQKVKYFEALMREQLRKNAVQDATNYIRNKDNPGLVEGWKAATNFPEYLKATTGGIAKGLGRMTEIPRAALTALHGGVFPVTHGGGLLMRPGFATGTGFSLKPESWIAFAKGFKTSWAVGPWGKLGTKLHAQYRMDLLSDPVYEYARQSGLKVNPEEGPQGIMTSWLAHKQGWSQRAWLGLQVMRMELFKRAMDSYPKEMWTPELGKQMADIANKATGTTSGNLGMGANALFAPQLTASKVARGIGDPAKTIATFAKLASGHGDMVSAAERAGAYTRLAHATEFLAFTYGALQLNNALNKVMGGDDSQDINFEDPTKSDWLKFKVGGYVVNTRGPEEVLRLVGHLVAISAQTKKELHGRKPIDTARDSIAKYAEYKINPGAQLTAELGYGTDVMGRALPQEIQDIRAKFGMEPQQATKGKPQFTLGEYALQKGPIFIGGAARDVYEAMREQGLSEPDAKILMRGALISLGEFAGFSGYREQEQDNRTAGDVRAQLLK